MGPCSRPSLHDTQEVSYRRDTHTKHCDMKFKDLTCCLCVVSSKFLIFCCIGSSELLHFLLCRFLRITSFLLCRVLRITSFLLCRVLRITSFLSKVLFKLQLCCNYSQKLLLITGTCTQWCRKQKVPIILLTSLTS